MPAPDKLATEQAEILEMMWKLEHGVSLTPFERRLLAMFREHGIRFKGDPTPLDATIVKLCSLPPTPQGGD